MRVRTPWIFDLGAGIYDFITDQEIWREHCRRMVPLVPGARVLDLGIGPGVSGIEMARAAPETLFVGLDLAAPMIARARAHIAESGVHVPLVRADVARLPFPDASFDGATAHSFLYLLPDSAAALREVHRVVKPGGRVAFLEPGSVAQGAARARALARAVGANGRFGLSMILWTIFSGLHGRWSPHSLGVALESAGFRAARVDATLDGLGLLASAHRD